MVLELADRYSIARGLKRAIGAGLKRSAERLLKLEINVRSGVAPINTGRAGFAAKASVAASRPARSSGNIF